MFKIRVHHEVNNWSCNISWLTLFLKTWVDFSACTLALEWPLHFNPPHSVVWLSSLPPPRLRLRACQSAHLRLRLSTGLSVPSRSLSSPSLSPHVCTFVISIGIWRERQCNRPINVIHHYPSILIVCTSACNWLNCRVTVLQSKKVSKFRKTFLLTWIVIKIKFNQVKRVKLIYIYNNYI